MFWPILVFYFVLLFVLSMKKQIRVGLALVPWFLLSCPCLPGLSFAQHMIKYKYIPFTFGKQTYKGKEDTGKVIKQ